MSDGELISRTLEWRIHAVGEDRFRTRFGIPVNSPKITGRKCSWFDACFIAALEIYAALWVELGISRLVF
jgi:hypothetical protein